MDDPFDEFTNILNGFADGDSLASAMEGAMQSGAILARAGVMQCFEEQRSPDGTPWPELQFTRPNGGNVPLRDTDRLMASVHAEAIGDEIVVQTNRVGAAVQNFGATIVPVNVQFLTIPMTVEAKMAGGARLFPHQLFPRIAQNRQSGVLVDAKDVVQYLLLKKATIPQREFIGFSEETVTDILTVVAERYLHASLNTGSAA